MVSHVQYNSRGLAESISYGGERKKLPGFGKEELPDFVTLPGRKEEKEITMRTTILTVGALGLSLLGTGCVATHKYVAKTVAPVEQRVSGTEAKNTDQDKELATHTTEIADLDKDLS